MSKIRIAMIASFPAILGVFANDVKPSYRNREHPSSWVKALCEALMKTEELELKVFVLSRAVRKRVVSRKLDFPIVYIPHRIPARFDPLHAFLLNYWQVKRAIDAYQPRLIHAFGFETGNGIMASHFKNVKKTGFVQGIGEYLAPYRMTDPWAYRVAMPRLEKRALLKMNGVVVESDFAAGWVKSSGFQSSLATIPHAVNTAFVEADDSSCEGHQVLCIGGFFEHKGFDTVIKALSSLCGTHTCTLGLVGAGPLEQTYKRLAESCGVADRVEFKGVLSREQIINEMKKSFCLVMPSRMDTSPNVITEAQAMALPIIGTRVGGIPDLVAHGMDGYLFTVDDNNNLSELLARLMNDRQRCRSMGLVGKKRVLSSHISDVIAQQHVTFFKSIIAGRK